MSSERPMALSWRGHAWNRMTAAQRDALLKAVHVPFWKRVAVKHLWWLQVPTHIQEQLAGRGVDWDGI